MSRRAQATGLAGWLLLGGCSGSLEEGVVLAVDQLADLPRAIQRGAP